MTDAAVMPANAADLPSTAAEAQRRARARALLPGSPRDHVIAVAKVALPAAAACLLGVLVAMPMFMKQEFSFVLSKDSAPKSDARMRLQELSYRGQTAQGQTFEIRAESGVQKTSSVPVVLLRGLSATIDQQRGPATVSAPSGEFQMDTNRVVVDGPVIADSAAGFSLDGDHIVIDINDGHVHSDRPVTGSLPMGSFSANSFAADVDGRRVVLEGRAHIRLNPRRSHS